MASWSAHALSTDGDTLSGPGALRLFCFLKKDLTHSSETAGGAVGGPESGPPGQAEAAGGPGHGPPVEAVSNGGGAMGGSVFSCPANNDSNLNYWSGHTFYLKPYYAAKGLPVHSCK